MDILHITRLESMLSTRYFPPRLPLSHNLTFPRDIIAFVRFCLWPQISVMRVLTLMLAHDMDGQIDEVLKLAEAFDFDEDAFRFRHG